MAGPMDHLDDIWEDILLRERVAYEGSWLDAYHPAAIDAVSRRYQFWELEHGNPHANLDALINRPRIELTETFQRLAMRVAERVCNKGHADPIESTVLWNRIIRLKWEERKQMMRYIPAYTGMQDPLLPYPEPESHSVVRRSSNGDVMENDPGVSTFVVAR